MKLDIIVHSPEEEDVFFEMTGLHCCVNMKTGNICFDFSDKPITHPKFKENAECLGLYMPRYKKYMTIYDFIMYCLVHEPLHLLIDRMKPKEDYCPMFDKQGIVDNFFLDDIILESLGIVMHGA